MGVNLEYYKSNLTLDNINEYKLFFLCRKSSLSFFVLHIKDSELVYFRNTLYTEHFKSTFSTLYKEDPVLSKFTELEYLAVDTGEFSLMPTRLYNPEQKAAYFKDLADLSSKYVESIPLANNSTQVLFSFEKAIIETIEEHYQIGQIIPNFSGLINSTLQLDQSYVFLIHFEDKNIYISYTENTQLKFFNRFEFNSTADVLYYVLKVCSVLKIDPKGLEVMLSGNIDVESEIFKALYKYIHQLDIYRLTENFNIPLADKEIHYFNDIFAILKK